MVQGLLVVLKRTSIVWPLTQTEGTMSVSPVAFGPFAASDGSVGDRALALTNYKTHVSACVRPHASQRAERAGDARRWGGKPKALRAFLKKGSQRRRWGPEPPGRRASGAREHGDGLLDADEQKGAREPCSRPATTALCITYACTPLPEKFCSPSLPTQCLWAPDRLASPRPGGALAHGHPISRYHATEVALS